MSLHSALRYAEQRLNDAPPVSDSAPARGYRSRRTLLDAARRSYALFQHQHCPMCQSAMSGEFKVYYRREGHAMGDHGPCWQRLIAVQAQCPACGHTSRRVIGSGPEPILPADTGAAPAALATITRIQ